MTYPSDAITIRSFSEQNVRRCETVYHGLGDWNPLEWAGAAAGETGELANICKKVRRRGRDAEPTPEELVQIAHEAADAVTYIDLLLTSVGLHLDEALVDKFNIVSERIGYIKPGMHNGGRMYARY